jgi:hypothetical protein
VFESEHNPLVQQYPKERILLLFLQQKLLPHSCQTQLGRTLWETFLPCNKSTYKFSLLQNKSVRLIGTKREKWGSYQQHHHPQQHTSLPEAATCKKNKARKRRENKELSGRNLTDFSNRKLYKGGNRYVVMFVKHFQ